VKRAAKALRSRLNFWWIDDASAAGEMGSTVHQPQLAGGAAAGTVLNHVALFQPLPTAAISPVASRSTLSRSLTSEVAVQSRLEGVDAQEFERVLLAAARRSRALPDRSDKRPAERRASGVALADVDFEAGVTRRVRYS
jgi:hypothetical protein